MASSLPAPLADARQRAVLARTLVLIYAAAQLLELALVAGAGLIPALGKHGVQPLTWLLFLPHLGELGGALFWLRAVDRARSSLGLPGSNETFLPSAVILLASLLCLPCLSPVALLVALRSAAQATDPQQLPPRLEERDVHGGFRDNAVVQLAAGRVAQPRLALWAALNLLSFTPPLLSLALRIEVGWWTSALVVLMGLTGSVLLWQIVDAIDHNLDELSRRAGVGAR